MRAKIVVATAVIVGSVLLAFAGGTTPGAGGGGTCERKAVYTTGTVSGVTIDLSTLGAASRLATVSAIYSGMATGGWIAVWTRLNSVEYLQMSNDVVNVRGWTYTGTDLWFKPEQADKIIYRSNITNGLNLAFDFVR